MTNQILKLAIQTVDSGTSCCLATVTSVNGSGPRHNGSKMLIYQSGDFDGTIGGGAFEYHIIEQAKKCLQLGKSTKIVVNLTTELGMCCGGKMEVFLEVLHPPEQLIIYGGGHVGRALSTLANLTSYKVTVIDSREQWIDPHDFPEGVNCIYADPITAIDKLPFGIHTSHFITTHSHAVDQQILMKIYNRNCKWLGMIGSKTKRIKFLTRFKASGIDPQNLSHLHSPAGLEIGAETPMEIAISIMAEIIQQNTKKNTL